MDSRAEPLPETQDGWEGRKVWLFLVPGLLAVVVFLAWSAADGGYAPTTWYPGALFLLAVLVLTLFARRWLRPSRPGLMALALLALFTAWSFLSIAWADVKGDAWDGANRTLLYLIVYALFVLWPQRSVGAASLLGLFSFGVALVGAIEFIRATAAEDPAGFFVGGRFDEPVGYVNANCALFLIAFWPAFFLATRRELPILARAASLGVAGVLLELAVTTQSRGSLFAFPIVVALYVVIVPGRVRAVVFGLPIAAATLLSLHRLLDIYDVVETGQGAGELRAARTALVVSFAALAAAGGALAVVDRRLSVSDHAARVVARVVGVAASIGALAAAVILVSAFGSPVARAADAWAEFKAGQPHEFGSSHFAGGGLGSNRYDFWRVAMGQFRDAPLSGIGADNFAVPYVRERRSDEEPLYPHSLEVRVLSQTGLVGGALFVGYLAFALAAAWRARVRVDSLGRAVCSAAVVAFAYWLVHGSVDWFWELPGLTAPALAFLGMAAALVAEVDETPLRRWSRPGRTAARAAIAAAALFAVVTLAVPWVAATEVERAAALWRRDPDSAYAALDRARRLNFLSDRPDLVAGAIASRLEDPKQMRAFFLRALERNPHNWYAYLELGIAASLQGERQRALQYLAEARRLDPLEPAIPLVSAKIRAGARVSPHTIDRLFLQRVDQRTS